MVERSSDQIQSLGNFYWNNYLLHWLKLETDPTTQIQQKQNRWIQTNKTGGQLYSDTYPQVSVLWLNLVELLS